MLVDESRDQTVRRRPGERLHHVFEDLALRRPTATAVVVGDTEISFAELDRRANRLARRLRAAGAGPGDRVALLADDAVAGYAAVRAALKVQPPTSRSTRASRPTGSATSARTPGPASPSPRRTWRPRCPGRSSRSIPRTRRATRTR
ncbi:AMP-binding protein [Pseudonocardia xishanensis]|uniref:AMP-dependent synthetase/ligase domain-containing protein n=1 Tax=Pseudonocardia xishanensis TaxID=630995 RepID=A0ABP8RCT2_9PSEU